MHADHFPNTAADLEVILNMTGLSPSNEVDRYDLNRIVGRAVGHVLSDCTEGAPDQIDDHFPDLTHTAFGNDLDAATAFNAGVMGSRKEISEGVML